MGERLTKMLHQALILTSHREYAQAMRQGLLKIGHEQMRVDVETDAGKLKISKVEFVP